MNRPAAASLVAAGMSLAALPAAGTAAAAPTKADTATVSDADKGRTQSRRSAPRPGARIAAAQHLSPPAQQLAATDTFTVRVSDADSGFHLHGLMGLVNLLTFGLIGSAGHTATRTVTPTVDPTAYILPVNPDLSVKTVLPVWD